MDYNQFVEYYKSNHEFRIFHTRLEDSGMSCYLMYIYEFDKELENFKSTFLYYLPFYVRNSDQLASIDNTTSIESQLEERSKSIKSTLSIVPKRNVKVNGIYGELFLDFYLRIVCKRNAFITYAQKRAFSSNIESLGIDNVVYYIDEKINICFCEAKFVSGASNAKNDLLEDINGTKDKSGHMSEEFINSYLKFIVEKGINISPQEKERFEVFLTKLNSELDKSDNFLDILKKEDVCINFIFFAIFDSTQKKISTLKDYYDEIYNNANKRIQAMSIINFKIEIIFIPVDNQPLEIKKEIELAYE